MPKSYRIKSQLWIEVDGKPFLGYGRVMLLERIRDLGSISAAARSLGMAYNRAWKLVESMNEISGGRLVERNTGGVKGGGTSLTDEGHRTVKLFRDLNERCTEFLESGVKEKWTW